MSLLHPKPSPPVAVTRRGVIVAGGIAGCAFGLVLILVAFALVRVSDTAHRQSDANRRLAKALAPSDADVARGATAALNACIAQPACRNAFRGAIRRARLRPSDVPALRPRNNGSGSGGGGGGSSGGSGSSSGGSSQGGSNSSGGNLSPTPRGPTSVGNTPQPTVRPPAASPTPANPPASPPTAAPKPTPAPAPTPQPPPPVPTVSVPPAPTVPSVPVPRPPVVPPVTVPVPVRICTPLVTVNCVDPKKGRVVGPEGHAADPVSSSGRGNESDPLCERIKAPCDPDTGNPVFPPGLIRLP